MKILRSVVAFIKKRWILVSIGVVVLVIIILLISGGHKNSNAAIKIEKGGVLAEVSVTGSVKPAHSLDIAFEIPDGKRR